MSTIKMFFQRKSVLATLLLRATLLLAVFVSMNAGQQNVSAAGMLPCDIYAAAGTPCVAAHSTIRALFGGYNGNLYQVKRSSDGTTTNIETLTAGGYANASTQDSFCAGTLCTITMIYDQTSRHNDLTISPAGGAGGADVGAVANALPLTAGGHKVYGVYVTPGTGYRNLSATGTAVNGQAEGMYMVTSGKHVNGGCCFDYGNTEQPRAIDTANGHMDAVYFGLRCEHPPCSGSGPWIAADLENGLFQGNGSNTGDATIKYDLVTAMLKNNGQTTFVLKTGNAQSGGLTTQYSGTLPNGGFNGYTPMHQEGGIVLGVGGDNSNSSAGSFFEGIMTSGYPTDAADNSVQANILSVGYSTSSNTKQIVSRNSGKCLDVQQPNLNDGANVGQWACNGNNWQRWVLTSLSDGYYQIASVNSGKCLDVQQPNLNDGANVDQWTCNGNNWQQWALTSLNDGYYQIVSVNSGKCLDVQQSNLNDGANVDQRACDGNNWQQWTLQ